MNKRIKKIILYTSIVILILIGILVIRNNLSLSGNVISDVSLEEKVSCKISNLFDKTGYKNCLSSKRSLGEKEDEPECGPCEFLNKDSDCECYCDEKTEICCPDKKTCKADLSLCPCPLPEGLCDEESWDDLIENEDSLLDKALEYKDKLDDLRCYKGVTMSTSYTEERVWIKLRYCW